MDADDSNTNNSTNSYELPVAHDIVSVALVWIASPVRHDPC